MEKRKYDAFISYRHTEPDKYVATTLHKKLENFKLPKKYREKCGRSKIERVFRDQDELPLSSNLSDSIDEALHNTDFLIVICSPRLPQSQWCLQEIDTFISLYGRERILAVLCEGEPHESFPEALIKEKIEKVDENGETIVEYKDVEPLAADVRGKSKAQMAKAIDDAVLRIAAPMFGLDYDDLKQRHRERKLKKLISFISVVAAVLLVFSLVSMSMALQIKSQSNQIQLQNEEITKRNAEIEEQNAKIEEQYIEASQKYAVSAAQNAEELISYGRKKDALYTLLQAMPESSKDTSYPYTAETERVLLKTLEPYTYFGDYVMGNVYEVNSIVSRMSVSYNSTYALICDENNGFSVWNNLTDEKVYSGEIALYTDVDTALSFTLDEDLLYINTQNKLVRYSFVESKETVLTDNVYAIQMALLANKCIVIKENTLEILDLENNSFTGVIEVEAKRSLKYVYQQAKITNDGRNLILAVKDDESVVSLYNLDTMKMLSQKNVGDYSVNWINYDEEKAYILCDKFQSDASAFYSGKVYAFNLENGQQVWENSIDDSLKMGLVSNGENSMYFAKGYYCIYCFDKYTGEVLDMETTDEKLISMNSLDGKDSVFLYNTNGECLHFPGLNGDLVVSDYFYTKPKDEIKYIEITNDGILVYFDDKDFVVYYKEYMDYPEDYLPIEGKINIVNAAGTKGIELTKNENENNILKVHDIKTGDSVEIMYDASDYFFVGNGEDKLAQKYSDRVDIYNISDGSFEKSIVPEKFYTLCGVSADGECVAFCDSMESMKVSAYSLENSEEEATTFELNSKRSTKDKIYVINNKKIVVEDHDNGTIEMYSNGEGKIEAEKELSWGFVNNIVVSSDNKYLLIAYKDNSIEVCDLENKLDVYTTIYDIEYYIKSVNAIEEGYIFNASLISIKTNKDFEILAGIPFNSGYVKDCGFLKSNQNGCYYVKNYSLDDLLNMAREQLGDYVPSDRIIKQYNILKK